MFQFTRGCSLYDAHQVSDAYCSPEPGTLKACVSREKIRGLFDAFLELNDADGFSLFLEEPVRRRDGKIPAGGAQKARRTERTLTHLYYMDGMERDFISYILDQFGEVLLEDGFLHFGISSDRGDELGRYDYNVMILYAEEPRLLQYESVFMDHEIRHVRDVTLPWELISFGNPGRRERVVSRDGWDSEKVIACLKENGLYLAETMIRG